MTEAALVSNAAGLSTDRAQKPHRGPLANVLRLAHRWTGLALLLFWAVQAASGLFLVFHRELDDWTLAAAPEEPALELTALSQAAIELAGERNARLTGLFSSTGYSSRFDAYLEDPASGTVAVARLDGQGRLLRERPLEAPLLEGGLYLAVYRLHRQLLSGPAGGAIVGVSGLFLLAQILVGVRLAWPAGGQWRKALLPRPPRSGRARFYALHRAAGLWLAPAALVTVACGVGLAFERPLKQALGASNTVVPETSRTVAEPSLGPQRAARSALARFPGSDLTGMEMPGTGSPHYVVFLRQPREPASAYGATRVFVSAAGGGIVAVHDPVAGPAPARAIGFLLPIHSGQIGAVPGRFAVAAIGLWLIATIMFGSGLWWARRQRRSGRG